MESAFFWKDFTTKSATDIPSPLAGEGQGEGEKRTNSGACLLHPHPNPSPLK